MSAVTPERLREVLHYDPTTGLFTWKVSLAPNVRPGDVVMRRDSHGYVVIQIDRRTYKGHRLAWLYMTGLWPSETVDHIDGQRDHNAWANLREATVAENTQHSRTPRHNTSGLKGASWDSRNGRWVSQIQVRGRCIKLGSFDSAEAAHVAYRAAAKHHFGKFARLE
jgi:hypothetical protein